MDDPSDETSHDSQDERSGALSDGPGGGPEDGTGGGAGEDSDGLPPEPVPAMGTVVEQGRGSLPFALLHGEALVACAAWGLGEAGVTAVDVGTPWSSVVASGEAYVLHDSLCPMTPPAFIAACLTQSLAADAVVVAVRPVTDTVKRSEEGVLGDTLDRDGLWAVTSPLVLPPRVVASLGDEGPAGLDPDLDVATLVQRLARDHEVVTREAPSTGRRVGSREDVELLAAFTEPDR